MFTWGWFMTGQTGRRCHGVCQNLQGSSPAVRQVRTKSLVRIYLAVLHGTPKPAKGRLEHYLKKDRAANMVKVVNPSAGNGKQAILEYSVLEEGK